MRSVARLDITFAARRAASPLERAADDTRAAQQALLAQMMQTNRDTEYGRRHHFAEVRTLADYARNVPVADYEDIRDDIDRIARGEPNILTAEQPLLFAQTSGTTGKPKLIPVTPTSRQSGALTPWLHYAHKAHPGMFAGAILTIVSPAVEGYTEAHIPYGSTSGMIIKELPRFVQSAYAVPYAAFEIEDYGAKYYALLRFGLATDVTFIGTANPSSILTLAELADRHADLLVRDIHDGTLSTTFDISPAIRAAVAGRLRADPAPARALAAKRPTPGRHVPPD